MKKAFIAYLKGIGVALIFTFLSLALTALIIKNVEFTSKTLSGIMIFIKGASIALGSAVFCRITGKKGALCGTLTGAVYSVLITVLSVAIGGEVLWTGMFADAVFSVIFGAVSGIIWVNIFA